MNRARRNLLILGVGSVGLAILMTSLSLFIYHKSGDIYLDRSRPGFLPDQAERKSQQETDTYVFTEQTPLDDTHLQTFIFEYQKDLNLLKSLPNAFGPEPLSDLSLGLKTEPSLPQVE